MFDHKSLAAFVSKQPTSNFSERLDLHPWLPVLPFRVEKSHNGG